MRHWSPEQRAKQAELIKQWKPWHNSTGPRTERGKQSSCQNARKYPVGLSRLFTLSRKRQKYQEKRLEKIRAENREYMRSLGARIHRLELLLKQRAKTKS